MYTANDHTFVICAYGISEYLEECIQSLNNQNIKSKIIMVTSTPSEYINILAGKYHIPIYINYKQEGIAADWNYAYKQAQTKLVTIAHQDDIYCKEYTENVLRRINEHSKPLIAFTDYSELRDGKVVGQNRLLKVKRILLSPLKIKVFAKSRFIRRRILSFGSAICCPSVTMVKENLPEVIFHSGMKSNIDWEAWEILSRLKGDFIYCSKPLMCHRIHEESTTTQIINGGVRKEEDLIMFNKFWPSPMAKLIEKLYINGEKSNKM